MKKSKAIKKEPLKFKTEKEIEDFMRADWSEHQENSHPDDCMPFTEYISNCDFLLKGTGWYWDGDNYMFRKVEEE